MDTKGFSRGIFLLFTIIIFFSGKHGSHWPEDQQHDPRCASTGYNEALMHSHAWFRDNLLQIEQEIRHWEQMSTLKSSQSQPVIVIPVVFHVVYNINNPQQNISDQQIISQLEALNRDFRRQNPDTVNTPAMFRGAAADVGIEFRLAQRTPHGQPTSGITRTATTVSSFNYRTDAVKFDHLGGKSIWDRNRFMNIWICNLDSVAGYAQYPGGPASSDGIVLDYQRVGTTGTVKPPNNQGRTATHEVGHWLNLRHIWGDDRTCGSSDHVDDTPEQEDYYSGCPSFPQSSCGSTDMFMNYMDYTNDQCMNLFTLGQKNRMLAVLNGFRSSLKSSNGLLPPDGTPYISIGPVPVRDNYINLFSSGMEDVPLNLTITDILGRQVYFRQNLLLAPQQQIQLPAGLAPGIYIMSIYNEEFVFRKKFFSQKNL